MKEKVAFEYLFQKTVCHDDQEAFQKLFFEFYPSLCVFATKYIDSQEAAEDIVQTAFLKLWKNRKKIVIESSFRNFLLTIVRNGCLDYLRKEDVKNRYMRKEIDTTLPSLEEIYTLNELEEKIENALKKLHPHVRNTFVMNRFEKMTYKEISQKMNLSHKTIEKYIGMALRCLRVELKDFLPILFWMFYICIKKNRIFL